MGFGALVVAVALTFGACYLIDYFFKSKFRSKTAHTSSLSVRLNKRYATFGVIFSLLNQAFTSWFDQIGCNPEGCVFHAPENGIWFPVWEVE